MTGDDSRTGKEVFNRKVSWWKNQRTLGLIVATLVIGVLVAMANAVTLWTNYDSAQLAAAGGWIGGIGSVAAVTVALMQTSRANEAAKDARLRADRDIAARQANTSRVEEYESVHQIMKAVSRILTEVVSFKRFTEVEQQVTKAMEISTSADSQKESIMVASLVRVEERQRGVLQATNDAIVDTRIALLRIQNRSVYEAASEVLLKMLTTRAHYSTEGQENDWGLAAEAAQEMNEVSIQLQQASEQRFRMADDNIPSPEIPREQTDEIQTHPFESE